jgi:hypothetical protein
MAAPINPVERKRSAKRLMLVVDKLRSIRDPILFDFNKWVKDGWTERKDPNICRTPACALGHACAIPELKRLGLKMMVPQKGAPCGTHPFVGIKGKEYDWHDFYSFSESLTTAMEVFILSEEEARFLFVPGNYYYGNYGPSMYASATDVASHIEQFVKNFRS